MESIVFANSPLAEYLEGNGENQADWGIEPVFGESSEEPGHSFAPSFSTFLKSKFKAKGLKPLTLSNPGSSRRALFYELFSKAVDSRLSRRENSRFLERFRYVIVASQLLNEHVNISHYDRKTGNDPFTSEEDDSSHLFGSQYVRAVYWAASGGCVLAVFLLFAWVLRGSADGGTGLSKGRATTALLLSATVAIFLFAHARRRWLRSLRAKAIEFAAMFVEKSQAFDVLTSNVVTLIQEVELVSRGYRLSTPLPPITRLERDSQTRRCARLRKAILSSLSMGIPPHNQACAELRHLTQEVDLEKYYDIYDIQPADLEEMEIGVDSGEFDDTESLKALKTFLHRLHTVRRVFLCCLLALDADGSHEDYTRWRVVLEQLRILGNLMGELGGELKKIMGEEGQFFVPPTPKTPASPKNERCRGQLRKLNSLSQALRGLQAKMHVLREESDRTLHESTDLTEFGPDLIAHYDSIGSDLHSLVDEWENGRSLLAMSLDRQDRANSASPKSSKLDSPGSISGSTLVGDTPRNSLLLNKDGLEISGVDLFSPVENRAHSEDEEVYEAVAEPRPRSMLNREERILKVQEERAKVAERRKTAEAGLALQTELKAVLVSRPPPRRRTVSRTF